MSDAAGALSGLGSALDEEGKGAAAVAAGVRDANKRTALHFAAREGRTEVCQFLVEQLRLDLQYSRAQSSIIYSYSTDCEGQGPLTHSVSRQLRWLTKRRTPSPFQLKLDLEHGRPEQRNYSII